MNFGRNRKYITRNIFIDKTVVKKGKKQEAKSKK